MLDEKKESQESFRDSISTVNKEGQRVWVFPKKPFGFYYNRRTVASYFLLTILFLGPFIRINGEPFLLFNILERHFVVFGKTFWPQDSHLFALAFLIGILFVIVFTLVFGRLFCGWICPQTIFMEMVFRKIEYWIEGDWNDQKKLDQAPWNAEKIRKKSVKFILFFLISFLISNVFLAYIIGSEALFAIMLDSPLDHVGGLLLILLFTGVFMFVFSWLREQVCTTICPYGRLQGVLLDRNSMVVAYDHVRGEERAKIHKEEDRKLSQKGDCIDCKLCVHVCPTGIDIRNGTQLECTNCTACMDVCDDVMDKVGFEKGLIKYSSESNIAKGQPFKLTARIKGSIAVLLVLLSLFFALILTRTDTETTILRTPGMSYQQKDPQSISNLYNYKILNKSNKEMPVEFRVLSGGGKIELVGKQIFLKKQNIAEGAVFIIVPENAFTKRKNKMTIGVYSNGKLIEKVNTTFIGKM